MRKAQIIEAANTAAGRTVVRAVRVLAPSTGPAPTPAPATADGEGTAAPTPVRTRENASPGYRPALRAHQQAAPAQRVDHDVLKADRRAGERQAAAMRALSHHAFPDEVPRLSAREDVDAERRTGAEIEAAARRRARADRAPRRAIP
ncbi:putative Tra3 protein (plasmid) [Streptomyces sp. Tu6071]|nr:putative Tra3 protein [Streptomyces sp. Tu6071]